MNLGHDTGGIYERTRMGYADAHEVVAWADRMIGELDKPPDWLIDISAAYNWKIADFEKVLRSHASELSRIERLKITLKELDHSGDIGKTLGRIFSIWLADPDDTPLPGTGELPDGILDLLVEWDCSQLDLPELTTDFVDRCKREFAVAKS